MGPELRTAVALTLRHHPLCGWFDSDRFGPLCSGCAVFWPLFWLTTPLALWAIREGTSAWAVGAGAAVLGLPQLGTMRWRWSRLARAAIKGLGGVAVAGALAAILLLPVPLSWRATLLVAMALAFAVLMAVRLRSILRTCDRCPWQRDWEHCPGFAGAYRGAP